MKKEELISLNDLLFEVAEYVDESFDDVSLDVDSVAEDEGMANPHEVHRKKKDHRRTAFELSGYMADALRDADVEAPGTEPEMEGDELDIYQQASGIFHFYDDGEKVYKHSTRHSRGHRSDVLKDLLSGDSYRDARDRYYETTNSGSDTRKDFSGLLDSDEELREEYEDDMRMFVHEKLERISPA